MNKHTVPCITIQLEMSPKTLLQTVSQKAKRNEHKAKSVNKTKMCRKPENSGAANQYTRLDLRGQISALARAVGMLSGGCVVQQLNLQ